MSQQEQTWTEGLRRAAARGARRVRAARALGVWGLLCAMAGAAGGATTEVVSVNSSGTPVGGDQAVISADGRYVAFRTTAALVAEDTNGAADIYEYDRVTTDMVRVSVGTGGTQGTLPMGGDPTRAVADPAISADGRYVAFSSLFNNLVGGDNNGVSDVFVHDRQSNTTVRVSVSTAGVEGNATSGKPSITSNGRHVAFESTADNLGGSPPAGVKQIYVRDRDTDGNMAFDETGGVRTALVSVSADGTAGDAQSLSPSLSRNDGRYVAFESDATNLIGTSDTNGRRDVFVHDRDADGDSVFDETDAGARATVRVNVTTDGAQTDFGDSATAAISADGRHVAFQSKASNLAGVDEFGFSIDENFSTDVFVRDRDVDNNGVMDEAGQVKTVRVSVRSNGAEAAGASGSFGIAISGSGRHVTFSSDAVLAPNDANMTTDVYGHDRDFDGNGTFDQPGSIRTDRASVSTTGGDPAAQSIFPTISDDGQLIAFQSAAGNLVDDDTNMLVDAFVRVICDPPAITGQPGDQTVPPGGMATFSVTATGSGELSYQWQRGGTDLVDGGNISGATTATLTINPVAMDDAAADYRCIVSDVCGSTTSSPATLTVGEGCVPPVIVESPVGQSVCAGEEVSLSVRAGGTAPLSYQWRRNGTNINGATEATYTIAAAAAGDEGSYDVVVSNDCGMETSAAAVVVVRSGPAITGQPGDQTVPLGGMATFNVTAGGSAPLSYQWRRGVEELVDGGGISGATTATLTINPVVEDDAGADYNCVVLNDCGSVASDEASLTVGPACTPPQVTVEPRGQTICTGSMLTLSVTATGTAPLSYQWRRNGTNINGATNATFTRNSAAAADAGEYTVVVSNACGQDTSEAATVAIGTAPQITSQATGQTVCAGGSAMFAIEGAGAGELTYQWRKGGTNLSDNERISGATTATLSIDPVITGDAGGNYSCLVTGMCGSATSNIVSLVVSSPVTISTQPMDRSVSAGGSTSFVVSARGTAPLTYQWRHNGANLPGATLSTLFINAATSANAGVYDVVVTNVCGSVTSDPAVLTVSGGSPGPGPGPGPGNGGNPDCGACGVGVPMAAAAVGLTLFAARRGVRVSRPGRGRRPGRARRIERGGGAR